MISEELQIINFINIDLTKIDDKKEKIDIGLKRLKKIFSGEIDILVI